jgi:hypothetical protein
MLISVSRRFDAKINLQPRVKSEILGRLTFNRLAACVNSGKPQ